MLRELIISEAMHALGIPTTRSLAVIATGAYSDVVIDHCRTITHRDPWLTLTGLRLVHERNHS